MFGVSVLFFYTFQGLVVFKVLYVKSQERVPFKSTICYHYPLKDAAVFQDFITSLKGMDISRNINHH